MKKFSLLMIVSVLVLILASGVISAKNVEIKIGHVGAPVSPQQVIAEILAENVSAATNGTVSIRIYNSGSLGSEAELQQGVRSSTIDGLIAGSWERYIDWAGILQTPLIYKNLDHFVNVFTGPVGQELMSTIEEKLGVKPLFVAPHGGFRYITNSVRSIYSPEDMKGIKLRDPNVPAYSAVTKAMGSTPVPMDFSELYIALDRKVVDGQHNPFSHIVGSKFYEVQDYLSMVPYGIAPHTVTISNKAWNQMTSEQQAQVQKAATKTAREYVEVAKKNAADHLDFLEGKIEIIRPEELDMDAFYKAFNEKALPVIEKAYGEEGMNFLNAILETE